MKNKIISIWKDSILPFLSDPLYLSKWVNESRNADSDRRTVRVNAGYDIKQRRDEGLQLFMFNQDTTQHIVSYRRSNRNKYKATLQPSQTSLEQIVTSGISKNHDRNLTESLTAFIEEANRSIIYHAAAYYELTCTRDIEGNITKLNFHAIYPPSMKKVFGLYFQVISWKAARHSRVKAGIYWIPNSRLLHIPFPRKMGGAKHIRNITKRLHAIGQIVHPAFHLEAMQMNKDIGFDFDSYTRQKYIEIAQLTKRFGWSQRRSIHQDDDILEYYSIYRMATAARARAFMREYIIDKLNKSLNGQIMHLGVKVSIVGLQTTSEVDEVIQKLKAGNVTFSEIVERII